MTEYTVHMVFEDGTKLVMFKGNWTDCCYKRNQYNEVNAKSIANRDYIFEINKSV